MEKTTILRPVTETGKIADRQDMKAEQRRARAQMSAPVPDTTGTARIHALRDAIRAIDKDIATELHREQKNDNDSLRRVQELKEQREPLICELENLQTKNGTVYRYETGLDYLQDCTGAESTADGERITAPVKAMLWRFTCRFKTRDCWDVYDITATGKARPTQWYEDYVQTITAELFEQCTEHPADSFADLLCTAVKRGINAVWNSHHHRHSYIDPETGNRVFKRVSKEDIDNVIYCTVSGETVTGADGEDITEQAVDGVNSDPYQNTAGRAITAVICDEICRDRKPEDLQVLYDISIGWEYGRKDTAERKRKSRLIKRIRAEYPEYVIRDRKPAEKTTGRELPYIPYKYYDGAQSLTPVTQRPAKSYGWTFDGRADVTAERERLQTIADRNAEIQTEQNRRAQSLRNRIIAERKKSGYTCRPVTEYTPKPIAVGNSKKSELADYMQTLQRRIEKSDRDRAEIENVRLRAEALKREPITAEERK